MSDVSSYCAAIERYLVRRNGGHLVRIVGPAFELVRSWEEQGIPLNVVYQGIDRYVERQEAKETRGGNTPGSRGRLRRPARIEFCEADVLDVFDAWRKAVGLTAGGRSGDADAAESTRLARPRQSLSAHLDRVVARLTALRASAPGAFDAVLDATIREIDAARASARTIRGEARQALLARLRELDTALTDAAVAAMGETVVADMRREADAELAPFRDRMPEAAYREALRAATARLARERARLPVISFDA